MLHRAQSLFLALGALVRPGVNLLAWCKSFGAQLQILKASTPKEYLTFQKSDSGCVLQYGPIL